MDIEEMKRAKQKLEDDLRVVIEAELKAFEAETGIRPVSVEVETPGIYSNGALVGRELGRVRVDLGVRV